MVEESLEDILRTSFHNAQSGFRSVVYKVVEQVMLGLLHQDIIRETLDAFITKSFDTNATADWL